jgi:YbbR domain-containing protein
MPRPFVENWGLKLFSLALGIVIFLAVRNEQRLSTTVAVRLLIREPAGLVNTGEVPPEALVKISGPWGSLRSFEAEALPPLEVDLSALPRGTSTVRIREEQLGLPPDVDVVSISPSALTVRLEAREKRTVPVRPVLRGDPAPGYTLGKAEADPAEVEIDGPRREVREAAAVRTSPIDVGGTREEVLAPATLEAPGQHTRIVGPARAAVRVPVEPVPGERTVQLHVAGPAGPVVVTAVLRGPKAVLDRLDESALRAVPATMRGRNAIAVRIDGLPDGVVVAEPAPTVRARR